MTDILRQPAEVVYAHELSALKADDDAQKPTGWMLSPRVKTPAQKTARL